MTDPRHRHWVVGKYTFRYLHGTISYGIMNASNGGVLLLGFTNSDWGGGIVDQKRNYAYCFSLGFVLISQSSKKHGPVSQRIS